MVMTFAFELKQLLLILMNGQATWITRTAAIEVYDRGIPEMGIVIDTESDEYDPRTVTYRSIIATIEIDNEGDA